MFKKKTNKFLAMAFCAAVVSGLYAAPVMAAEANAGSSGTQNQDYSITLNPGDFIVERTGNSGASGTKTQKMGFGSITSDKLNDSVSSYFYLENENNAKTFWVSASTGYTRAGAIDANGDLRVIHYSDPNNPTFKVTAATGDVTAKGNVQAAKFNNITLAKGDGQNGTVNDHIYLNGIDITDIHGNVATIKTDVTNLTSRVDALEQGGAGGGSSADTAGIKRTDDGQGNYTTTIEGGAQFSNDGKGGGVINNVTKINGISFGGNNGNDVTGIGKINGIDFTTFVNNTNDKLAALENNIQNAGGETTVKPGTDGNITVTDKDQNNTDKNHDYELGLNPDLNVDSITATEGGNIGGVIMEDGKITAENGGTIGDVTIEGENIIAGNVVIEGSTGTVAGNNGIFTNITGDTANIGGVKIENNTVTAETGNFTNNVTVGEGKNQVSISGDDGSVTANDFVVKDENGNTTSLKDVATDIGNLEQSIAGFDSRINKIDDKINKVGAMAAAIANLRTMGYDPAAPTEIAVGVGQYRDETGAALGFFHYPNRDFMLSLSVSTSGEEVMGGIGATWKFGRKSPEAIAQNEAAKAEKAKLAKAEALKKAAEEARLVAQQERHAAMIEK